MGSRLLIALILVLVAVAVARALERRRRPDPPARGTYPIPAQLDRSDFPRPEAPVLMVLFSSAACDGCGSMAAKVAALESDDVATCEVEYGARADLHRRYGVEGVPMVVVADAEGVVTAGFVGSVPSSDLEAALSRPPAAG
jgi:Thioredoxin.